MSQYDNNLDNIMKDLDDLSIHDWVFDHDSLDSQTYSSYLEFYHNELVNSWHEYLDDCENNNEVALSYNEWSNYEITMPLNYEEWLEEEFMGVCKSEGIKYSDDSFNQYEDDEDDWL